MELNSFNQFNMDEKSFFEVGMILQELIEASDVLILHARNNPLVIDPISSIQIGFAIFMDKPVFMLITPGTNVPVKIANVVDRFIEFNGTDEIHSPKIRQKINESWNDFKNESEAK